MSWTRRRFLEAVGRAGGAAAAYETMVAMGLLRVPNAFAGRPTLPPDFGRGKKVLILGAGVSGMTAAYELKNAGYTVSILEAKGRPGGRNFTVRRGDVIEEITGSKQLCRFDEGLYLNAGPGRLPYHHTAVLEYCKILGVPLEVYIMSTRANLFQNKDGFGGLPMPNRRIANDTRGWITDLLAKAINRGALNKELTGIDKQALLDMLSKFGDVEKTNAYAYIGSSRSGYEIEPGVVGCPEVIEKLQLNDLLKSEFWKHKFYQSEDYEWQPTLFEPVGGMDGIVKGFLGHVGDLIRYNREVTGIHNADGMVRVEHRASGTTYGGEQETADYCISTIPLPILKTITNNNFQRRLQEGHRRGEFCLDLQGGLAGQPPLLGARRSDLRRDLVHQSQHHADVVPVARLLRREGRSDRDLQLRRRCRRDGQARAARPPRARRDRRETPAPALRPGRAARAGAVDRLEEHPLSARRLGR